MEKYGIISGPYNVGDIVYDNKTGEAGIISKISETSIHVVYDGITIEYTQDGFPLDNTYGVLIKQEKNGYV